MWNKWTKFIMCDRQYRNMRRVIIKSIIKKLITMT
mgnify:CR=1 FL=1